MCYDWAMHPFFLVLVLIACIGVLIVALVFIRPRKRRVYKPKGPYVLSPGEKRLFDALARSILPDLYICPKVQVADLIEVTIPPTDPAYWKTLAPINQKHVDFVLVNRIDFAPRVAIELDGGSHNDQERAKRDSFIDSVFSHAGIPMLHIPATQFYHYSSLREKITQTLSAYSK